MVIILLLAAFLSLFFGDKASFFIIVAIVALSVGLDFGNTYRSEKAAEALKDKVRVKAHVIREGKEHIILVGELVPGDIVLLTAGKVIPADGIIIEGKDISTNEAALTGESFPAAKPVNAEVFMGSGVISGSGMMRVTLTGHQTKFSHIAQDLQSVHRVTEFEHEIKEFSVLIIKITFFLVIFVLLINVVLQRDLLESILFSLALAVGLTPELLPLIITLNLTKGSLKMAKEGVIVKQLSAVQNFGSMDILCTDKTGTLTENKIALVKFVDGRNKSSDDVLKFGYLASAFSTSFGNPLDAAIRAHNGVDISMYEKIDEIPFDFERKREAVVVHHTNDKRRFLIVEGAPEEILSISTKYRTGRNHLTKSIRSIIQATYDDLSKNGFRVLAVASKEIEPEKHYDPSDETELSFHGFLAFLDPAKASVSETLERMRSMGISTKVITGDNLFVTEKICRDINLIVEGVLTGDQLEKMSRQELAIAVEKTTIFARVNPEQKMQIIEALQVNGHIVGYMGDGINDAPSLRTADVSISVNNAVDVAKDAADFILLRKNLHELVNGIIEGRKTFANTMKYLRMSLSSNFGNMFSMAGASLFLPFLPMLATQILLNNLLYDTSQFAIPLDNVDDSEVLQPHALSIKEIKNFMWSYGLLSSVFDFTTFGILLLAFHADQSVFQAGWFIESIMTQIFVIYIIRTRLIPFKESKPSVVLVGSTIMVVVVALLVILLPIRYIFHFGLLAPAQIGILILVVAVYLIFAEIIKNRFYGSGTKISLVRK
ncbi:magnesium-translocating P-type ATPase [Candidatus Saccharibacteria bacterium CG11_big_fil_rev_8_21_14_0_20_41_19]|nr:MAG: magnesium-translocating P-type ATPase [Candidatus Saccharibacteria bacterium CG11_big_fil_rev_8_21_14_0_20_41_19]PIZ60153.1 MAG: magnesium-translocating P-type ATPase [Candidatus Saccharibacteria bacterium CG_4_10_14_0_2_um_filter_41_11]PJC29899.1 MAG: magnesium-translocating P-type ATPase [Candidatus Saccharibacteria bacterium CG_4_9_14_0_2_um_filter_41_9]PJE66400.1 MAG: magnesium-translocating P-type ATPase [Candidatus Saccharibacteria bacterium CG10_big_fil_rev_8_21_14_0_10_41_32]